MIDGGQALENDRQTLDADYDHQTASRELLTGPYPREEWDGRETSPWVIIVAAILLSIPLGLCCYLLLKL